MEDFDWQGRYDRAETHWERPGTNPAFDSWLESGRLAPGRILVPGCGRGKELLALARSGFEVVAVDAAPTPVEATRAALAEAGLVAEVVQADLLAWEPDQPFDAIYEQTCLCALHPETWASYEARLHRWLKPGGKLFALFMQTGRPTGPPFHCDPGAMRELFGSDRWVWSEEPAIRSQHPYTESLFELGYELTAVV